MKKILFSILALFIAINLNAAVPGTITYQGVLTDGSGALVGDGNYDITFKLYDALTDGNLLWTEVHNLGNQVAVTNGVFSTELGGITTFASASLDFSIPYYLDITVGATQLAPRIPFNASGYAQNTKKVLGGTIDNSVIGGTTPAAGSFTTLKMTSGPGDGKVLTSDPDGNASWSDVVGFEIVNPMTAQGDIIYSTGNNPTDFATLGIGEAGQVLTVNPGATAPEWKDPASGSFPQVISTTPFSGTIATSNDIISTVTVSSTGYYLLTTFLDAESNNNPMHLTIVQGVTILCGSSAVTWNSTNTYISVSHVVHLTNTTDINVKLKGDASGDAFTGNIVLTKLSN